MRYEGKLYRPPSEARSYILQATVGCSWNRCTYCDMYQDKTFRIRDLAESLQDIASAGAAFGDHVEKVFVADGDALVMPPSHWLPILDACRRAFPNLRRVSCYAMATNLLEKTDDELLRTAKVLRNPHAIATTGVDLQVPAIMSYLKQRGLHLQGSEVVDIGSYGDRSHALSIRLSPVHIKAFGDGTMTLEKFWQNKKCLAVWEDEP